MASLAHDDLDTRGQADFSGLPLPGPTVVLDMRSSHETRLLEYLATEIAEAAREARLNGSAQWERLDACFAFLNIGSSRTTSCVDSEESFEVTPIGQPPEHAFTVSLFIEGLGKKIREARTTRIQALQQYEQVARQPGSYQGGLERATVRVLALLDLSEPTGPSSLTFERAVHYLADLKDWCEKDFGWEHSGSGPLLEIDAVCFNAHPRLLPSRLSGKAAETFQSVILIGSYRADYGHLNAYAQTSHAELILWALLLHWPEVMQASIEDLPLASSRAQEGPAVYALPRPTYLLGAAALEEPTRWGARWLHYGLAATMLEVLLDSRDLLSTEQDQRLEVQQWFNEWWQLTQSIFPHLWFGHIPRLQGLSRLSTLKEERLRAGTPAELELQLHWLAAEIRRLYLDDPGASLKAVLASADQFITLSRQIKLPAGWSAGEWQLYQQELGTPEMLLETFLLALFAQIRGCIPRARLQLDFLRELVAFELRPIAPWQPETGWREFATWQQQALEALRRLQAQPGGRRLRKSMLVKMREDLQTSLHSLLDRHYHACYQALAASAALVLLQEAGLYDPESARGPYAQRLEQLEQQLQAAHTQASAAQRIASHRLALGASSQLPPLDRELEEPATLHNRASCLQTKALGEGYARAYRKLTAGPPNEFPFFRFLAESLLRHLGNRQEKQENNHRARVFVPPNEDFAREQVQVLEAVIVTAFIAARAGTPETIDLAPLLARRQLIQQWLLAPPNALDSTLLAIREIGRFTWLEQAITHQSSRTSRLQTLPIEQALAALLANQPRDEQLHTALDTDRFPSFLDDRSTNRENLLRELDRQSVLASHFDHRDRDEAVYLYAPARVDSALFAQILDDLYIPHHAIIPIPVGEKMLYLRVSRLRQFYQPAKHSAEGENSPDAEKRKD